MLNHQACMLNPGLDYPSGSPTMPSGRGMDRPSTDKGKTQSLCLSTMYLSVASLNVNLLTSSFCAIVVGSHWVGEVSTSRWHRSEVSRLFSPESQLSNEIPSSLLTRNGRLLFSHDWCCDSEQRYSTVCPLPVSTRLRCTILTSGHKCM